MALPARQYQTSLDFGSTEDHYDLLHAKQHGTVSIWESQKASGAWSRITPDQTATEISRILTGLSGHQDTYFTVNEFHGWRITRLLSSLRACYVDIDLGRPATRYDLEAAQDLLSHAQLPWPSFVVFTGRGLHLYWCTKPTPAKALPVWQAIETKLIDALKPIGADPKARDCARVLRIAGTVNSKTGAEVRGLVLDPQPWGFHDLTDNVLGHREKAKVKSIETARKTPRKFDHQKATHFRRWHQVYRDLGIIGEHEKREYGGVREGYRNEFLFITSVALSWFAAPESIHDEVMDYAQLYCPDIAPAEVERATSQSISRAIAHAGGQESFWAGEACDIRYRFKRVTLWDRLGEIARPVEHRLRAIITDEQAAKNKKEGMAAYEKTRQARDRQAEGRYQDKNTGEGVRAGNIQKRRDAFSLYCDGASLRAIASIMGVSAETARKWIKQVS